jgi:hypothetical protein
LARSPFGAAIHESSLHKWQQSQFIQCAAPLIEIAGKQPISSVCLGSIPA